MSKNIANVTIVGINSLFDLFLQTIRLLLLGCTTQANFPQNRRKCNLKRFFVVDVNIGIFVDVVTAFFSLLDGM